MSIRRVTGFALLLLFLCGNGIAELRAQCANTLGFANGHPGTDGTVYVLGSWDPDGVGPLGSLVVVGGRFSSAGGVPCNNIALYDPVTATWSPLGLGVTWSLSSAAEVRAVATLPTGELVVGGAFDSAGGSPTGSVAKWDGQIWSSVGWGATNGSVDSLAVLPNGHLVAVGSFSTAGSLPANNVARWDGSTWSAFGPGLTNLSGGSSRKRVVAAPSLGVSAFAVLGFGYVATSPAWTSLNGYIALWNGQWSGGSLSAGNAPEGLGLLPSGALITSYHDGSSGALPYRVVQSTPLGGGLLQWNTILYANGPINSVLMSGSGSLMLGGGFYQVSPISVGGITSFGAVERQTASSPWTPLGTGTNGAVHALADLATGGVCIGGAFTSAGGNPASRVARWEAQSWSALSPGYNRLVKAFAQGQGGEIFAAGAGLARWSAGSWVPVVPGVAGDIDAIAVEPNGHVVAGGSFMSAGGAPVNRIAKWNGAGWSALGQGVSGDVLCMARHPNGDLIVGGRFLYGGTGQVNCVARWNGSSWFALGTGVGGSVPEVRAIAIQDNGDIVVGGSFSTAGGQPASNIAKWNGAGWSALGAGLQSPVNSVVVRRNGQLVAAGSYSVLPSSGSLAVWTGSAWVPAAGVGSINIKALVALPNDDIVLGGGGAGAAFASRWNGSVLLPFGPVFAPHSAIINGVAAMFRTDSDDVWLGGDVQDPSPYLARITTTCPASVQATAQGVGCQGSGGPLQSVHLNLPWTGGEFRADTSGATIGALAAVIFGFSAQSLSLQAIHPAGALGCNLLTSVDSVQLSVPGNGVVSTHLALPNSMIFAGLTIHHQIVQVEIGGGPTVALISASNALSLTVGSF